MKFIEYTEMLKALGENTRLHIFDMLRNGTLCGCKILEQLNITQPTPFASHESVMRLRTCKGRERLEMDLLHD